MELFNALGGSEPALARLADVSTLAGPGIGREVAGAKVGQKRRGELAPGEELVRVRKGILIPSLDTPLELNKELIGPGSNRD